MKPLFLIADDSAAKREFLKRYVFKQMDIQLLLADTTEMAKDIISQHVEIAAAFIDYQIPSENGPSIITHLKEHNPNSLVALVTSEDRKEYKDNALAAGADTFICTGWELDFLEDTLNTTLAAWNVQIMNQ